MAPGSLVYHYGLDYDLCISYTVGSWKMVLGDNCDTLFYFDGKCVREASSHRSLSPVSYVNEAEIYFTSTCTHVVQFQYDVEGVDLSFSNAPTYSIHSLQGYGDPGTPMIVYSGMKKYTIRNRGEGAYKTNMLFHIEREFGETLEFANYMAVKLVHFCYKVRSNT